MLFRPSRHDWARLGRQKRHGGCTSAVLTSLQKAVTEGFAFPPLAAALTWIPVPSNSVGLSARGQSPGPPCCWCVVCGVCQGWGGGFLIAAASWSQPWCVILEPAASWLQKRQKLLWWPISALWPFVLERLTWRLFLQGSQWFRKPL